MQDLIIRPSTKIVMASYIAAILVAIGGAVAVYTIEQSHEHWWAGTIPGIAYFIAVVISHLGLLMDKLIISADRLRHESGFISKRTHTIDLVKVQDVRVDQSVKQRLLGMGRLSVETSGGSSTIAINNVDSPHKIADMILERSRHSPNPLLP